MSLTGQGLAEKAEKAEKALRKFTWQTLGWNTTLDSRAKSAKVEKLEPLKIQDLPKDKNKDQLNG